MSDVETEAISSSVVIEVIDQLNEAFPEVGEVAEHLRKPTDDNDPVVNDATVNSEEVVVPAVVTSLEEHFRRSFVNFQPRVVVMVNSQNLVSSSDDSDNDRELYSYPSHSNHGMKRLRSGSPFMVNESLPPERQKNRL
ncbi:uncharacterized protein LOC123009040 [Tribolium madens]|uniref:uncharacterized protein LOC123009040 n=1 Tax=Tribolium madens TaxID=41895 RepID=UPI001CF747AE|nr:uncharacterized protein LOC123009040 [Tribolium madens]